MKKEGAFSSAHSHEQGKGMGRQGLLYDGAAVACASARLQHAEVKREKLLKTSLPFLMHTCMSVKKG